MERCCIESMGSRPTVNDDPAKVTCETFIPGFSGDLYGADPVVEFFAYLSPSKKFDTLDQLRDCIQNAARRARYVAPEPNVRSGWLSRYARMVTSANFGAVLQ